MQKSEEHQRPVTLLINLAGLFTISILGALASRQMAIHYGASSFGALALGTSFAISIQALIEFGQIQVLQRELVQSQHDESRLISLAITLRATIMLGALPLAYLIAWILYRHTNNAYGVMAIMMLSVPVASISQVFFVYLAHTFQNRRQSYFQVGQQALTLAGISILIAHHRPLIECAMVIVGSAALMLLVMYSSVARKVKVRLITDRQHTAWFLREAVPIGLSSLLLAFYQRADVLLLGIESTTREVGYYGVVVAINSFFIMMPTMLTRNFMPLLSVPEKAKWLKSFRDLLTYSIALSFGSVVVIEIGAGYVVQIFAGTEYESATTPLRILCIALIPSFVIPCLNYLSVARGIQRNMLRVTALMLFINVAANALVIPHFGIASCAWATLASELVGLFSMTFVIRKHLELNIRDYFRPHPGFWAAIAAIGVAWPLSHFEPTSFLNFALTLIVAGIAYALVLGIFGGFPSSVQRLFFRRNESRTSILAKLFARDPWVEVR